MNEKKNFDYKRLHPFKWYILENFPFLEDSIDVLTNYQLFCKLGEMYNKEVDAINTLGIQVEGLTDWFDNLDVQDEINNKLDAMVEDGTMDEIINQEIFGQINDDIDDLKNDIVSLNNKNDSQDIEIENAKIKNPNMEYMFTLHTESTNFQAMCADDNYYYLYDYANTKIIKRSLATNALISEIVVSNFGHGNGLTIKDNIIYATDFETRKIHYYNLTTSSYGFVQPFEIAEIINQGLTKLVGITKYIDNKLLISLAGTTSSTTKITDMKYYTYDVLTGLISSIDLLNNKKINLNGQAVLQDMEYQDGILYFLNSQPTQIVTCIETNDGFEIDNLYTYDTYDVLGIAYGEAEGITILPSSYNGEKTLMIYSQVNRWRPSQYKTLKFYCFNLFTHLADTLYPSFYENGTSKQLIQLNANATNYFENGKANYPFKDLLSAMEFLNNSNCKSQNIQLYAGHYYLQDCRNFKALLIPYEDGVEITGTGSFVNSEIHIGNMQHACTLNFNNMVVSIAKLTLKNCALTSSKTSANVIIQEGSELVFLQGSTLATNTVFQLINSRMYSNLTSGTRLPSGGQVFQVTNGSMAFLFNTNVPTTNIYRDSSSTIILPGYVNNT